MYIEGFCSVGSRYGLFDPGSRLTQIRKQVPDWIIKERMFSLTALHTLYNIFQSVLARTKLLYENQIWNVHRCRNRAPSILSPFKIIDYKQHSVTTGRLIL
jgi:hypothetical protein